MKTYNVIFELYGGIKAINGVEAENETDAICKATMKCGFYPVRFKECIEVTTDHKLKPGDIVTCKGISATIKEITFQEYWEGEGYYVEFTDTNGNYRNWKQWTDGGTVKQM